MAELSVVRTGAEEGLMAQYDAEKSNLPSSAWATTMRDKAADGFKAVGLPHRRVEQFKYTDLRAAISDAKPIAQPSDAALPADPFSEIDCHDITFVNGRLVGDLPSIEGVELVSTATLLASGDEGDKAVIGLEPARGDNPVHMLNTAFMADGVVLKVADGAKIDKPIHVRSVYVSDADGATFTRNAIVVGKDANVTIVESFEGSDAQYQTNCSTVVHVHESAECDHFRIQAEGASATHLGNHIVDMAAECTYRFMHYVQGSKLARVDLSLAFSGENANCIVRGANLLTGSQHADTTMFVDHAVPHCDSSEVFKTVLGGKANGVFQGKILVRPHAQKTDGQMSANTIMLSDDAELNAKPELEIYADDVVCGHGATVGQLDEDLLFYLKARGITDREAKALMIAAFVGEVFVDVGHEDIANAVLAMANTWISEAEL